MTFSLIGVTIVFEDESESYELLMATSLSP